MKLRYCGPHASVEVPELQVVASVGDEVEATGEVAKSLIASGLWEKSDKSSAKADGEE